MGKTEFVVNIKILHSFSTVFVRPDCVWSCILSLFSRQLQPGPLQGSGLAGCWCWAWCLPLSPLCRSRWSDWSPACELGSHWSRPCSPYFQPDWHPLISQPRLGLPYCSPQTDRQWGRGRQSHSGESCFCHLSSEANLATESQSLLEYSS